MVEKVMCKFPNCSFVVLSDLLFFFCSLVCLYSSFSFFFLYLFSDCGGVEDVLDTNRGGSTYDQGGYGTGDGTDEIYSVLGSDMTIQTAPGVFVDSSDVTMGVTGYV